MSILQVLGDKTLKGVARRQAVIVEILAVDNALAEIEASLPDVRALAIPCRVSVLKINFSN